MKRWMLCLVVLAGCCQSEKPCTTVINSSTTVVNVSPVLNAAIEFCNREGKVLRAYKDEDYTEIAEGWHYDIVCDNPQ